MKELKKLQSQIIIKSIREKTLLTFKTAKVFGSVSLLMTTRKY